MASAEGVEVVEEVEAVEDVEDAHVECGSVCVAAETGCEFFGFC